MSGDRFAQPSNGQRRQGPLGRGNHDRSDGFGINGNSLGAPFPPPPIRNNGSAQSEHGSQEILKGGAPPVESSSPVKPPSSKASFDGSTLAGSEDSASEPKDHLTTKALFQAYGTDTRVGDLKRQQPKGGQTLRSDSGEFQIDDLPTGRLGQSGRAMSITGENCLR